MSFLKPKMPTPTPPATPAAEPVDVTPAPVSDILQPSSTSLITTSEQGLKRKASTQRASLIGGG